MKSKLTDTHGKSYNRWLIMFLIILATFSGALMQTSLGTAIPVLMKSFDIDLPTAQQATTWFLLANGIVVPLSAYLATRVPTKTLHIITYIAMFVGILMTSLTPTDSKYWWLFVVGRIITAIAVGIMMPLMQILILNMFHEKERGLAMGLAGLVVGMSPAIGPTLSGWILNENHTIFGWTLTNSWQNLFILPLIVISIALILCPFLMKDIIQTKKIKLDWLSLLLSTSGFGLFLWGFTNVASKGWTDLSAVVLPIVFGITLLLLFAIRQFKLDEPFLDLRVFKVKEFTLTTVTILLVTMAMYGIEMMLPIYLQGTHNLSPFDSGLTLFAGAIVLGFMSPIAGILYNKVGMKRLAFVGTAILALGSLPFLFLTETTATSLITVLYGLRMFGIALLLMPLTTKAMSALPTEEATHGTAANNTVRQIASSIVVALLTSVVQNTINQNSPATSLKGTNPLLYADKMLSASMSGFQMAFLLSLIFAIISFVFIFFLKEDKK